MDPLDAGIEAYPASAHNPDAVAFIEKLFIGLCVLGIPGVALITVRSLVYGLQIGNLLMALIFGLFFLVVIFRRLLTTNQMIFFSLGISWAYSFASIYYWGLASQGYTILTFSFIICAVFYGRTGVFILAFFTACFFFVVAEKFVRHLEPGSVDVQSLAGSWLGWGMEAFVLVCFTGLVSYLLEGHSQSLRKRMQLLKEKQVVLERERELRAEAVRKQDIVFKEKQALVQEVHHRVQNNLHVISSLIQYQALPVKNEEARALLMDIKSRIVAFSVLHNEITQHEGDQAVDFGRYVGEIAGDLAAARSKEKIEIQLPENGALLPLDTALPCSLVAYEVLSMMIKHLVPGREGNSIRLTFNRQESSTYFFSIETFGVLLAQIIRAEQGGIGFAVIKQVCKSLDADYQFATVEGAMFHMVFHEYHEAGSELY